MKEVKTPDGKPLRGGLCTCSIHCTNSPYHDKSCCDRGWCDCRCHRKDYEKRQECLTSEEQAVV